MRHDDKDHDEPILELRTHEDESLTLTARMKRPPLDGAGFFDIESSARRCIGSLVQTLREAGADAERISRTRIAAANAEYCTVLAAVRDELLGPGRAINSIFLLHESSDDAFVTEVDTRRSKQ